MVDVLAILNTLSLAFQKQGILLVDIKHVIKIVTQIAIFFFFFFERFQLFLRWTEKLSEPRETD